MLWLSLVLKIFAALCIVTNSSLADQISRTVKIKYRKLEVSAGRSEQSSDIDANERINFKLNSGKIADSGTRIKTGDNDAVKAVCSPQSFLSLVRQQSEYVLHTAKKEQKIEPLRMNDAVIVKLVEHEPDDAHTHNEGVINTHGIKHHHDLYHKHKSEQGVELKKESVDLNGIPGQSVTEDLYKRPTFDLEKPPVILGKKSALEAKASHIQKRKARSNANRRNHRKRSQFHPYKDQKEILVHHKHQDVKSVMDSPNSAIGEQTQADNSSKPAELQLNDTSLHTGESSVLSTDMEKETVNLSTIAGDSNIPEAKIAANKETLTEAKEDPQAVDDVSLPVSVKSTNAGQVEEKTYPTDKTSADYGEIPSADSDATKPIPPTEATSASESDSKQVDVDVKLEVDSIQSFEEWKKKKIQDRNDAAVGENGAPAQRTIRTKKTQVNYASQDCGAKILSSNTEAKHVPAVLDENKDLYMLNPCSANIWFVIELCEPIQIRQLQLANFELFSSSPRLFDVSISERFPAREWRLLGSFEARQDRTLQTFVPPLEELMFAKYVKFEMKTSFGNEHYCPLSIVRVLGVSMVEEYEEAEETSGSKSPSTQDSASAAADPAVIAGEKQGKDDSVLMNSVYNIVKSAVDKMLGNGKDTATSNGTSTEATNSTIGVVDSALSPVDPTPSPADPSPSPTVDDGEPIDPAWESPATLVTNKSEVESTRNVSGTSPRPIVTLIETGDGEEVIVVGPPLHPLNFLHGYARTKFGVRICWFLELVYKASLISCIVQPPGNRTSCGEAFASNTLNEPGTVNETATVMSPGSEPDDSAAKSASQLPLVEATGETGPPENKPPQQPTIRKTMKSKDQQQPPPRPQPTDALEEITSKTSSGTPPRDDTTDRGATKKLEVMTDKQVAESTSQSDDIDARASDDVTSPEVAKIEVPDVKHDAKEKRSGHVTDGVIVAPANDSADAATSQPQVKDKEVADTKPPTKKDSVVIRETKASSDEATAPQVIEPEPDNRPKKQDIKPDVPVDTGAELATGIPPIKHADAVTVEEQTPLGEDHHVVINPGTNQKESVLMRLSNRIRALEQNMSLSSAYLEDLSQSYKRQMDEMQKAFNRTTARLTEGSRRAAEKDKKQQVAIEVAQNQTSLLRKELQEMSESYEYLNHQMIARHLCLMALEFFLLIIFMFTCFGVQQARWKRRIRSLETKIRLRDGQIKQPLAITNWDEARHFSDDDEVIPPSQTHRPIKIHPRRKQSTPEVAPAAGTIKPEMARSFSMTSSLLMTSPRKMKSGGQTRRRKSEQGAGGKVRKGAGSKMKISPRILHADSHVVTATSSYDQPPPGNVNQSAKSVEVSSGRFQPAINHCGPRTVVEPWAVRNSVLRTALSGKAR